MRSVCVFIFGVTNLVIELDAKYVKGMINNPNLQPNATINRWIAGILLFHFELRHILVEKHAGPDSLSWRSQALLNPPDVNDVEGWLDDSYSFCVTLLNDRTIPFDSAVCISSDYVPLYHLASLPPSDCPFFLPNTVPHFPLTYATVFSLSHSEPVPTPDSPVIPQSPKALVKEARMCSIHGFLDARERPADLTDAEFQSFVNSAMKFFLLHGALWQREPHGRHQQVAPEGRCYGLIREAHDDLGHKGVFTVRTRLLLRFWWPMLVDDVKWFIQTCHECQVRQTQRFHIPPTIPIIGGLFRKVHIDTMLMPCSGSYRYIVQARCALTAYPEWRMLRSENSTTLSSFIFEDLLCRWGPLSKIVTDNGPAFVQALDILADRYDIRHICISPYNSQANGVVEQRHYDVWKAIVKSSHGGESRWYSIAHSVFWAKRVTIVRSTGLSPYFMVHSVEPLFPFDISKAMFLVPPPDTEPLSLAGLIAWRA